MYCSNCGNEVAEQAVMCVSCGCPPRGSHKHCWNCASPIDPMAEFCVKCGVRLGAVAAPGIPGGEFKSKMAAGLLGIFLGCLGIHRFYLGFTGIGVAQLLLGLGGIVTCGISTIASSIWGLIEGILILTGSINRDAQGRPLKE